ncbi:hypothetical protein P8452_25563 [Trifolium repens]|nr:hypothetical protein P8452_25563 [Trifolium repens]
MSINDHKLVQCNEKDKETLLIFKKGINDSSYGKISTWLTEKDCCAWEGVHCDNITKRVTELHLGGYGLKGEMNLSILQLEFLSYLDLSWNRFDLSPHSSLKYLNLSNIELHKETNWLQAVNTLPSLLELQLSHCNLNNFIINPSIEYLNLSSLLTLGLSFNNFSSQFPDEFFNITKDLTDLKLRASNIHGEIPSSLLNLQNLRYLDFSINKLQGSIPDGIGQLANIQYLDLSYNMLSDSIPSTIGNLSSLKYLDIGHNNFSGEISENTFSKLSNLDSLDLSYSNFVFQFDLNWVPPFQLHNLILGNTNQGPNFPPWIYAQKSLLLLDLSSSGISLVDRNNFSSLLERIPDIILSNNSITEDISNLTLERVYSLYLDQNNFTGGLPNISSPTAGDIDLSYNSFSGSIPQSWKNMKYLYRIKLWSNRLSGEVLEHLSDWTQLAILNLGENEFSGTIPINMSQDLEVLILRSNKFEGNIPTQLFKLPSLFHLDLAHNKLSGSIPNCVYNLTLMVTFHDATSWYVHILELFTKEIELLLVKVIHHVDRSCKSWL